jgi:hypothetical protein
MTEPIKPDVDALIEANIEALRAARAKDGPAMGGTTWASNHYTAPNPPKSCNLCQRGPQFYEGCSHCDCPQRRVLSAALKEMPR